MNRSHTLLIALLVVVVLTAGAVGVTHATDATSDATNTTDTNTSDANGDATNTTGGGDGGGDADPSRVEDDATTEASDDTYEPPTIGGVELGFEQLHHDGTRVGDSPESVRLDGSQMWWAVHWPAGGIGSSPGDPDDPHFEYVSRDGTVDRDAIWLRTVNIREPYTVTATVATYDIEHVETRAGSTERRATNAEVQQQEIEVGQGWVIERVDLPSTNDEQEVAVWLGDSPNTDLRWQFTHETTTTAQDVPFSTYGGMFAWLGPWFLLPLLVGSVTALGGAKAVVRRTGVGPGYTTMQWTFLFGTGAGLFVWAYYGEVTSLMVEYPFLVAAYITAYLFAVAVDHFDVYASATRFIQPTLNTVSSPDGSTAADQIEARERTATVIDRPEEPAAVATRGLKPFLARLLSGKAATLRTVDPDHQTADKKGETTTDKDPLQCRIPVSDGNVDQKIMAHPKMGEPIDYSPEGFTFEPLGEVDDVASAVAIVGVIGAMSAAVYHWFGVGLALVAAAVGFVAWRVQPQEGTAKVWLSPLHYRSARATAMHLASELDDADTITEEREKRLQQAMHREKDIMKEADRRDETLMEGLYSFASDSDDDNEPGSGFGLDGVGRPDDFATDGGDDANDE